MKENKVWDCHAVYRSVKMGRQIRNMECIAAIAHWRSARSKNLYDQDLTWLSQLKPNAKVG